MSSGVFVANDAVGLLWFAGAFTLVVSALLVQRPPSSELIKMALAWVVIFSLLFLAVYAWQIVTQDEQPDDKDEPEYLEMVLRTKDIADRSA